jgi:hypothetical protein
MAFGPGLAPNKPYAPVFGAILGADGLLAKQKGQAWQFQAR